MGQNQKVCCKKCCLGIFVVHPNGSYIVTVNNGCPPSVSSIIFNYTGVGISESVINKVLSIFPNPNTGTFTLAIETIHQEDIQVKVFNVLGESVYASQHENVNGSFSEDINLQQPTGIYFVQLQVGDKLFTKRVVVQE